MKSNESVRVCPRIIQLTHSTSIRSVIKNQKNSVDTDGMVHGPNPNVLTQVGNASNTTRIHTTCDMMNLWILNSSDMRLLFTFRCDRMAVSHMQQKKYLKVIRK